MKWLNGHFIILREKKVVSTIGVHCGCFYFLQERKIPDEGERDLRVRERGLKVKGRD